MQEYLWGKYELHNKKSKMNVAMVKKTGKNKNRIK